MTDSTDTELRIGSLSSAQKRLLCRRLQQLTGSEHSSAPGGRLVAAVVSGRSDGIDAIALREYCKSKLPPYMVPQLFSAIAAMPKTAAGKIDRNALEQQGWSSEHGTHDDRDAPMTDVERKLADIWADVLGFDEITVDDNFFEVGGDSLLTIRILSRAAKAGLNVTPAAFFANPTIAEQARLAGAAPQESAAVEPVSGGLLLTPIQRWFFAHIRTDPQHWNQSFLFEFGAPAEPDHVARAVGELLRHHDALRASFSCADGRWTAQIEEAVTDLPIRTVALGGLDSAAQQAAIHAVAVELNGNFDLAVAPLLRVAHFVGGTDQPQRLLIVAHHLVVDAESWRILLSDFETLLGQLSSGRDALLPPRTTSLQAWAARLDDYSRSAAVAGARASWHEALTGRAMPIPADFGGPPVANREANSITLNFELEEAVTGEIVEAARTDWNASVNAVLLSALGRTISEWTGESTIGLDTEGHGREALFADADLSRTVGWFTTVYPLTLKAAGELAWHDPHSALRLARGVLQSIRHNGVSFGLLQDYDQKAGTQGALEQRPGAGILFNYLGRTDGQAGGGGLLRLVDARCGPARSAGCERAYRIEINASIADGRLVAEFSYNDTIHRGETIERLGNRFMAALRELNDASPGEAAAAAVAADFPLAGLDQQDFESLSAQLDDLDDE